MKSFTNFGQKSKSKSWDIYWTFKGLLIVTIFWLLLLSGRGQEHRFNPPNSGDDNDSDNNDNDNVENKISKKASVVDNVYNVSLSQGLFKAMCFFYSKR